MPEETKPQDSKEPRGDEIDLTEDEEQAALEYWKTQQTEKE